MNAVHSRPRAPRCAPEQPGERGRNEAPISGDLRVTPLRCLSLWEASTEITTRDLEPGDLGWVIQRHGEIYSREFGWSMDFEVLVADIATSFAKNRTARERAWIAEADGRRAGCVFLVKEDEETAKLRILLVDPSARGLGIGSRLVRECLDFAKSAGYRRIVLWTNSVLTSARRIYEAAGFALEREEPHRSFGKDLVGQYWAKSL